ncbi:leucine-rich repeat domain-containing protein [Bacteroidales bacterium OttesenSCG-928-M06]|nr:leucine-rich repeat domain-containing protein [Bacteroidales bacterium OttesenSCG-928-M06]
MSTHIIKQQRANILQHRLLVLAFFIMGACGMAQAQTVRAYSGAGGTTLMGEYTISTSENVADQPDLRAATKIVITADGTWSTDHMRGLRIALKNSTDSSIENANLVEADLSAAKLTHYYWGLDNNGFCGLFRKCTALTTVTMPATVPTFDGIGNYGYGVYFKQTFNGCSALTTITHMDQFNNISSLYNTFDGCEKLLSIAFSATQNAGAVEMQGTFYNCKKLASITNLDKFTDITNLTYAFTECNALTSIVFAAQNASGTGAVNGVSMYQAFNGCLDLRGTLDLSSFNKITNLHEAFRFCWNLTSIAFSTTTKNEQVSMRSAFLHCENLESITNLSSFSQISDLTEAFRNCYKLTSVSFPTTPNSNSQSVSMEKTFENCRLFNTAVDLSSFSQISSLYNTFKNCEKLPSVTFLTAAGGYGCTNTKEVTMESAFYNCPLLTTIDLSSFSKISSMLATFAAVGENSSALESVVFPTCRNGYAGVVSMQGVFENCDKLQNPIDLSFFTNIGSLFKAFKYCRKLPSVTFSPDMVSGVNVDMTEAFQFCEALTSVSKLDKIDYINSLTNAFGDCKKLSSLTFSKTEQTIPVSMSAAFRACGSLATINNLNKFRDITDLYSTFMYCPVTKIEFAEQLPNGKGSTYGVSMDQTFFVCEKLTSIKNLDTFTYITNLSHTFAGCFVLLEVAFGDQTAVPDGGVTMESTFNSCKKLTSITGLDEFADISSLRTTFFNCWSLGQVKFSPIEKVRSVSMDSGFFNCYVLEDIENLESFIKVRNLFSTFHYCYRLTSVKLGSVGYVGSEEDLIASDYWNGDVEAGLIPPFNYTFVNANPNMIKYLPKGTVLPEFWGDEFSKTTTPVYYNNFIDGNKASDNPTAYGDIVLYSNHTISKDELNDSPVIHPAYYKCPLKFTVKAGSVAKYIRPFTADNLSADGRTPNNPVIIPFEAVAVLDAVDYDPCNPTWNYIFAKYNAGAENGDISFERTETVTANTPHIVLLRQEIFSDAVTELAGGPAMVLMSSKEADFDIDVTPADGHSSLQYAADGNTFIGNYLPVNTEAYYINNDRTNKVDYFTHAVAKTDAADANKVGNLRSYPLYAYFKTGKTSLPTVKVDGVDEPTLKVVWEDNTVQQVVVWLGKTADWNEPSNWYPAEVPASCIDVYIPGKAVIAGQSSYVFPVLEGKVGDGIARNTCRNIYFMPGAQLGRPDLLHYQEAHVEIDYHGNSGVSGSTAPTKFGNYKGLEVIGRDKITSVNRVQFGAETTGTTVNRGIWNMFSAPLKEIATGDFAFGGFPFSYINQYDAESGSESYIKGKWAELSGDSKSVFAPGQGFGHMFRHYTSTTLYGMESNSQWDRTKNNPLVTAEEPKHIKADDTPFGLAHSNGIVYFPFYNDEYLSDARREHVFKQAGDDKKVGTSEFHIFYRDLYTLPTYLQWDGTKEEVSRTAASHRFIFEDWDGKYTPAGSFNEGDIILVGNPYMSALDFNAFYAANSGYIKKSYQIYDKAGKYYTYDGDNPDEYIAPMQSFLVEVANGITGQGITFTFNAETMAMTNTATKLRADENPSNRLTITASNANGSVSTWLRQADDANDTFCNGDFSKIIDAVNTTPQVYTLTSTKEGKLRALFMNSIQSNQIIVPIGVASTYSGEIDFAISGMDSYNAKVYFVDTEGTEQEISDQDEFTYSFTHDGTTVENRFYLRLAPKDLTAIDKVEKNPILVSAQDSDLLILSSESNLITSVQVYDLQGRLLSGENISGSSRYRMNNALVNSGIYIVKVYTEKETISVKVIK